MSNRAAGDRRAFPPSVVVEVKALACELPSRRPAAGALDLRGTAARGDGARACRPDQRHNTVALARPGCLATVAPSQLGLPARPELRRQGRPILDLYHRRWQGTPLGPHDYVLSADEKTSIQARKRKHPSRPPTSGRPIYVEHEYARGGAWAYIAAWDVHRAKLFGRCERKTRHRPGRAPRRPDHASRALLLGPPRLLDRRQRLLPSRPARPSIDSRPNGPTSSSSTPRFTHAGSTRSKPTSPSSSARSSRPMTYTSPQLRISGLRVQRASVAAHLRTA
jgi:hypothetical protein